MFEAFGEELLLMFFTAVSSILDTSGKPRIPFIVFNGSGIVSISIMISSMDKTEVLASTVFFHP
jgi:hypothetical protein